MALRCNHHHAEHLVDRGEVHVAPRWMAKPMIPAQSTATSTAGPMSINSCIARPQAAARGAGWPTVPLWNLQASRIASLLLIIDVCGKM